MASYGNKKTSAPKSISWLLSLETTMWWLILMSGCPDCLDWHEKTPRRRCGQHLQLAAQVKQEVTEDSSPAFVALALPLAAEWIDPVVAAADFFAYLRTWRPGFHHGLKNRNAPGNIQVFHTSLGQLRQSTLWMEKLPSCQPLQCETATVVLFRLLRHQPQGPTQTSKFPELAGQPFWQ